MSTENLRSTDVLLSEAKAELRAQLNQGAHCPCCTQFAKIYERRLNSGMAACLLILYRIAKEMRTEEWIYVPAWVSSHPALANSREYPKLRYWGLVEQRENEDPDKKDSGFWRLTESGRNFVRGELEISSHVRLYDGRSLGFSGKPVTLKDCLGNRFSYQELMNCGVKLSGTY